MGAHAVGVEAKRETSFNRYDTNNASSGFGSPGEFPQHADFVTPVTDW